MPSAAWIAAAKKTPMRPVFYAACESVDAINVEQKLASEWLAGNIDNLETFDLPGGGGAGLRPKLFTYSGTQVNWHNLGLHLVSASTAWFFAPTAGYLESISALWRIVFPRVTQGLLDTVQTVLGWTGSDVDGSGGVWWSATTSTPYKKQLLRLGLFAAGSSVPAGTDVLSAYKEYGSVTSGGTTANVYPVDDANFSASFRAQTGTITTAPFDLGTVPNVNSRILIEDMVTGAASITYVCEGSSTGVGDWVSLGTITDGREVAPYRYYRFVITFVSTGYDTPELYSIRVVGGNQQMVYLGTHRGEPALASGEVQPYLNKVSSISSKIALKDKPTVGDLTLDLAWMPLTSDLVQSTGKRRSVTVYLGFEGLARTDYEPYFTGLWESYTADQERRTFTVKLRDVWKKFKKKVPEQQSREGVLEEINHQFGLSPTGSGTALNIIDAIVQVADMAKTPDRFIDREGFTALKAAHYTESAWNVYRVLTDQKESDDLLKELAVTAGLFLVPTPDGKLTPYHYDTIAASTPVVTLDAAQIRFTGLTPDMAETVTRHNIFFNLIEDSQGRRSGGSPEDFSHVYTTVGSINSVVAERDREEVIPGEWFDNWGLAAGAANGVPNPLTQLADRLESWYTPIATVSGKQVATTKTSVRAENVPLRYFADVMPGQTVYVDNLRLPCPIGEWGGFSNQVKFLVMGRNVDTRNYTLTLDLFQITALTYTQSPTWHTYSNRGLLPPVTALSVIEQTIAGSDGIVRPGLHVSFVPPPGNNSGAYEVWVSEGGTPPVLQQNIPATQAGTLVSITIPAQSGVEYSVTVITVSARGSSIPPQDAPTAAVTVGTIAQATTGLLQLLNPEVTAEAADDYFTGKKGMLALFDTRSMVFEVGVTEPGVTATYTEAINQAASAMSRNRDQIDALNSIVSGLITSTYVDSETYVAGEFVTGSDGKIYRAVIDVPINTPPPNVTYWELTSDIITLVNTIQQNLDAATGTWESTAASLTTDVNSLIDPATGRVTLAETNITQNAQGLDIVGQSITGPPIFLAGVVEPGVQIESPADVVGLEVQVSRSRINLDTANAAILLGAGRIDTLTGRVTSAEIAIDGANAAIALRATQTDLDSLTGAVSTKAAQIDLDGANAAILLRATHDDLDGEVAILSDMLGLKLDAGPISAGLLIEWTDETHTKSRITAYSDTFRIMQPDGSGAKSIFTVGSVAGSPAVGISGADLFIDGSILARHIAVDQLVVGNNVTMGPNAVIQWANLSAESQANLTGADGVTYYTWIKYGTSAAGDGLSDDPTGKAYIGLAYNKTTATESTNPADYTWSLIQGPQGDQGVPGDPGADGQTTYTWIKYADVADGTGLYDTPTASTLYIGIAVNKTTVVESSVKTDYVWSRFRGEDGSDAAVPSYITLTKITATTIESPTISAGIFTGSQFILGDGTTYGKIETYDFANKAAGIQIQDGVTPTLTIKGGTFTGSTLQTAPTGQARVVISSASNSMIFYNAAEEIRAGVGTLTIDGLNTYSVFGTVSSGDSRIGIVGYAYNNDALYAYSVNGNGVVGNSTSGYGVKAESGGTRAPFKIIPGTQPANGFAGDIYFDSSLNRPRYHNGTAWVSL